MKYCLIIFLLISITSPCAAQEADSLFSYYQSQSSQYLFVDKDSAQKYLKLYRDYAKEIDNERGLIESFKLTGILKYIQSEYDSSLHYYMLSKGIAEDVQDVQSVADVQSNIGLLENNRGNFKQAIKVLTEACIIYDSLDIAASKGRALINISMSYESLGLLAQAEKGLQEAASIFKETQDKRDLAKCYVNLGMIKKKKNEYDIALVLYNEALALMDAVGDVWGLAGIHNNIGSLNHSLGNYDEAIDSFLKTKELSEQLGDRLQVFRAEKNLAVQYKELGDLQKAKLELDNSYQDILNLEEAQLTRAYYIEYAEVHEGLGNYQQSLEFYKKYLVINDSLSSLENAQVVSEIENKYQSEKKDQEIKLLAKTNEVRLSQRNIIMSVAIGLFLLGATIFYYYRDGKGKNRLLQEKNTIIEETLSEREVLLREIHHRVKNNLQIVSSLLNIQSKLLRDPSAKKAVQTGRDRVQSMALTHKLLYQNQNLSNLSLKEYISQLSDSLKGTYGADEVTIEKEIDEVLIDIDTAVNLGLLINELISNSMKHAFDTFESAIISIKLKQRDGHVELIVSDNGKGLEEESEKRGSYGMRLIRSLTDALKANLSIDSSQGTEMKLTIPTI